MKHCLILIACCLAVNALAQKAELIKGRWIYKDLADKEKLDAATVQQGTTFFSTLELVFSDNGTFSYNSIPGTWKLNAEETKILFTLTNPMTKEASASELEIRSLTEKELRLNMIKADVIMVKAKPAPAKSLKLHDDIIAKCGTPAPEDVLINLVFAVKTKNLDKVMNTSCGLGVKGYTLSDKADDKKMFNINTQKDEECICYKSNEKVQGMYGTLDIFQFKSGDIRISFSLSDEKIHEALFKKCSSGALTLLNREKLIDYYGTGTNEAMSVIVFPNGSNPISSYAEVGTFFMGGGCTIYNYSAGK
ncbi:MAG: hypothetical protein AB7G44_11030 [Bacteroidia bacterium]